MASVRYIADDVDAAAAFYRDQLDFRVDKHNPGKFAALERGDLILYLSAPDAGSSGQAGAGQAGDGPEPGDWNRFRVVTEQLDALLGRLVSAGVPFRGGINDGGTGRARLVEDPSGNLVELFEFKRG